METTEVIALTNQFQALAPDTGRPITVVGVDMTAENGPRLICLVTDLAGTRVEVYDQVKN